MLYDLTESMPDQDGFGIGIITKQAMEKLVDPITYYAVRYEDKAKEQDFRKAVYDTYKTTEYIEKESNTRISLIFHEADDLTAAARCCDHCHGLIENGQKRGKDHCGTDDTWVSQTGTHPPLYVVWYDPCDRWRYFGHSLQHSVFQSILRLLFRGW